jgi:beta-1,4-mannosyltransferase
MGNSETKSDETMVDRKIHVVVIVLGDVGRSPRMQYHALSLLQAGHTVSLVGYIGEDLIPELHDFSPQQLHVVRFHVPSPKIFQYVMPIYFVWRIVSLSIWLLWMLFVRVPRKPSVDCVLVQNPPALPLLFVAYFFCRAQELIQGYRPGFVIDWHNLGYSMLGSGAFQRLAEAYERAMAPLADGHLTVTKAMKYFLQQNMMISEYSKMSVLYDCPPAMFQPLSFREQHEILAKLDTQLCKACPRSWYTSRPEGAADAHTLLTEHFGKDRYEPRRGRPALVTSSTSWTPDEDFGILLAALVLLDKRIREQESNLTVLVVVTGKGPQKALYQEKMSKLPLQHVAIQTVWLEPADYPKLLACADMGVSLHTSTSGLDLPMKILDLFGCRVPVCAMNFACLSELVNDDVNGRVFDTSSQLADQMWELLEPLAHSPAAGPHTFGRLEHYSRNLQKQTRWSDNWKEHALPVLLQASSR